MWLENVEGLEEAEDNVKSCDNHVEHTDAVEWQLTVT